MEQELQGVSFTMLYSEYRKQCFLFEGTKLRGLVHWSNYKQRFVNVPVSPQDETVS